MKFFYIFCAAFCSYLLISCSPSRISEIEESLYLIPDIQKYQTIYSTDSLFNFRISTDWYEINDETKAINEVWLLNDNKKEVIKVSEIVFFPGDYKNLKENLILLANLSLGLKQRKYQDLEIIRKPLVRRADNLIFADYEIRFNKEQIGRIIVFNNKSKFYEIFAYCKDDNNNKKITQIFSLQQYIQKTFK